MTRTPARVYGALLGLYPRSFRERYGDEMRAFHAARLAEARTGAGRVAIWARVLMDALRHAPAEHLRELSRPPVSPPIPARRESRMNTIAQDVRFGLRSLARRPVFALTVIGTIALGVGANAAIFSVVNGILLRPLPYPNPDRVVSFNHEPPTWLSSDPDFIDYQKNVQSLSSLAAYTQSLVTVTTAGEADRVRAVRVSPEFFATLGSQPVRGRLFGDDEFRGNPPTAVILSHGYWTRRFGADPAVVGTSLVMNGVARTIVGVMPEHFNYPDARSDLWVPMPRFNPDSLGDRANNYLFMVGRMKPGVSVDHLRADANVEAARIVRDNPQSFDPKHPLRPHIEVVSNQLVKNARPYLMALLGTVGLVLLIACANVANLLLARAEGRRREMALRSALGASGRRLVTQLVTECGVVALIGGAIGLMSAWAATHVLVAFAPGAIPRIDEVRVDWRVVVFTFAASAFTAIVISLVPAFRALRDDSYEALRSGTRSLAVGIAGGARRALVIAEVALAVVALSGAGMLLRSLWHLQSTDTGFDTRHVLTARVAIAARQYNDAGAAQFFETLMDRIRSTPGVTAAGAAGWLPVVDAGGLWGIIPEGRAYGPGSGSPADQPASVPQQITPGYFAAAGIRIIAGRDFTNADRDGAPYVAIVSKEMAKTIWPGEDAIGKRFRVGGGDQLPLMTVVGVVGDIRSRGYADHPEPTMYFPFAQTGRTTYFMPRAMGVLVRTTANPRSAEASVRAIIRSLDPGAPVSEVRTLEEVVGTSITTRRFSTSLLAMFAALALLLAGIGTYGVIAYGVAQRTYEIGVRIALGAERRTVLALVMSEGLVMCGAGLGIGLVAAVFIARALRSMLVDVPVIDAVSLGMTAIALALVAMLASVIPARRAMKVSPLSALNAS